MISIYIAQKKIKGVKKIFLLFGIIYLNFNIAYATNKIKVEYRVIKNDYDRFEVYFKSDKKIDYNNFMFFLASIVAQKNNQDYFYIKKRGQSKGKNKILFYELFK